MQNQARCIAHEIKNQISICELYSQIIKKHLEKDNIKNPLIDNALICITRALKIMANNLIDLKTLDNLQMKKCDLREILKDAINLSTVYIQDKDIKISLELEERRAGGQEGKPFNDSSLSENLHVQQSDTDLSPYRPIALSPYVYIDENKFLACIVNIIKNAVEAIEHKGEINVSTYINDKVHIFISNNGEPIKDIKHIFDEGFTTKKTGSGLGLAICKEYLKEQNAELKLTKSNKDLTEFQITIPIA
jgi:signal transduction histidine kinase